MFITNSYHCHDVVNGHATLLTVAVNVAALPYEMLLLIGEQNVLFAVERRQQSLVVALVKLAGFVGSLESRIN